MAMNRSIKKNVRSTRPVILSVLAMLELLLLCISLTFSWYERALDPILSGSGISTTNALLSTVNVTNENRDVDLGQYFDMGSKTRFSPVYSDNGVEFTSPEGVPMNAAEIYSAALSFQFKIESASDCQFWIGEIGLIVNDSPVNLRGEQRDPLPDEGFSREESSTEATTEDNTDVADSNDESTDDEIGETTTDPDVGTEETIKEGQKVDQVGETEAEEEKTSTKETDSANYASAFVICFNDGVSFERFTLAEWQNYTQGGTNVFSYSVGQDKVITCSIWLDAGKTGILPAGAEIEIDVRLVSDWSSTRTVILRDETTLLIDRYPLVLSEGYDVVVADRATGRVYDAIFDSERGVWYVELPVAIEQFDVLYFSKGVNSEIIATWNNIDGRNVHQFALMDEGVYISSES